MYLWLWWSTRIHVEAANDTLNPGGTLNYTTTGICSKKVTYCLGFIQLTGGENVYLVIISNKSPEVWMKNRPVDKDSAVLSLNRSGVLKIESQHGKPIILYSPPKAIYNTKATLLDTGNFVLQQLHPNGTNTLLWQSFDYPTDTLLPTQKLGVNHKTGHRWLVFSWFTNALGPPGAFSLEWEHVEQELIVRRRGKVCWRSGKLRNNRFEYISEDAQRRLKYTLVSNGDENSFSFTTAKNEDPDASNMERLSCTMVCTSGELRDVLTKREEGSFQILRQASQLDTPTFALEFCSIFDGEVYVARADLCYGYNNTDGGCQRWQDIPKCRNPGDVFQKHTGFIRFNNVSAEENISYGHSDCEASCWSNCTCIGFMDFNPNEPGCIFFHLISAENFTYNRTGYELYLLVNTLSLHKGTKKWTWIVAVAAAALLAICLLTICLALKKRKYVEEESKEGDEDGILGNL
ncbi:G-type lectin S-receptor-like serine/threonine-protein [Vigna angularis]|uniref:G-type lectin S-receptor-like serine/threonine-protein n=1 Tax=Phaseolus angularis TaxID=3914 RepID=A0A8T0KBE6_PHAAN|nr:G-type lectin S-receptor-like serine/threonine-protein [Vigna angularis]